MKDTGINKSAPKDDLSSNVKLYFREYCQNSSIHGLKYLASNEKRMWYERLWWICSIGISLFLCISLIMSIYIKWENSPIIVSFATKETPIWQTPFPVLTICPETKATPNKFNYHKFLLLNRKNESIDPENETKFGLLSLLCNYDENINIKSTFNGTSEDIIRFYEEVQPDFFKTISDCRFMGKSFNCPDLFVPIFTEEGICYSFNMLDRHDIYREKVVHYKNFGSTFSTNWSLEYGYPIGDQRLTYPFRALFAGVVFALEAKLTVNDSDLDYFCKSSIQGHKMEISHPSRVPRPKYDHIRIPLDQAVMTTLILDMMSTSKAVKNYNPRRRNCYMPNERPLTYFKIYTQQNCKLECLTNYTLNKCGCTTAYMPRENVTRICNGVDNHCVYLAEMDMLNASIDGHLLKLKGKQRSTECDCLPICSKMNYIIQSSQLNWNWAAEDSNYTKGKHMSTFQVFFKDNQFITSERNELFGPIDFVANLGGLLGLFVGFSMLSLIEIVYYITLRLIANFNIFGRKYWAGNTVKENIC
ncbi:pickpocket protein 28-like [Diabrotica undecimpunctata]|uniref:pickpocket protein 28-like n=1 Tax=Diabrotica undecimpunctata TaxID=50387 RepID=UPI003B63DD3B